MFRSALSKVAWVGRTASMVFGLALVMALVLGVASMALGANGDFFKVGRANLASAVSVLTKSGAGPALSLRVDSGPALKVNSAAKVTNLNADKLDGKDFGAFNATRVIGIQGPLPQEGTFTSKGGTLIVTAYGSGYRGTGSSLTHGRIGMEVFLDGRSVGFSSIFANQRNVHQVFVPDPRVLDGVPAGEHTIRLEAAYVDGNCNVSGREDQFDYCTATDLEDRFKVLVTEIPD